MWCWRENKSALERILSSYEEHALNVLQIPFLNVVDQELMSILQTRWVIFLFILCEIYGDLYDMKKTTQAGYCNIQLNKILYYLI